MIRSFRGSLAGVGLDFNPTHLLKITDDTGVFQHCRYDVPNRQHGYTLDDNARALIVAAQSHDPALVAKIPLYLSFVEYCQRPDGRFRNFMAYDRRFLEEVGSPDAHGRALWSLGVLYRWQPNYRQLAQEMINALLPHTSRTFDLRTKAFAILGLHQACMADPSQHNWRARLKQLAEEMADTWDAQPKANDWHWFEDKLTYENARLPQAMLAAYLTTNNARYLNIGREAAAFLERVHFGDGFLKLVGCAGWYQRGQVKAEFDEQPVDAGGLVEMYALAYKVTGDHIYAELAERALAWYTGRNCHRLPLYLTDTGGCYDGLTAQGVNLNQGSESVLSYLMAVQSLNF